MNLTKASKITRVSNAVAAGTTDINSDSIDMQGFDSASFVVSLGTITAGAVTSAKVQGSADDSSWNDLADTGLTIADDDDNQLFVLEVDRPQHRYLRCVVDRGTQNAVVDGIVALQTKPDRETVSQPTTTTVEYNHAPAAGTA